MSIGDAWSSFMGSMYKKQSFDLLDAFADAGGNFIDTANCYQSDQSETWIGDWMEERGNRDQMVIATTFSFQYKAAGNTEKTPANSNFWGNHKRSMHVSLRDSLAKLQTEWVDVLYVHLWDYTVSIAEVMDSLHLLVQQGKVMYLGISDSPAWVVAAAKTYAQAHGKTTFSVYQGNCSLLTRDLEREILPMAVNFGMAVIPWGVLGMDRFQTPEQVAQRQREGGSLRVGEDQSEDEKRVSEVLFKVAKRNGTNSLTAVALAYVRSKAPNVLPIIGGRKTEHLQDNIRALDITLSREDVELLEGAKAFDMGFPSTFIGQDWRLTGQVPQMAAAQGPMVLSK